MTDYTLGVERSEKMLNDYHNFKYGLFISIATLVAMLAFIGMWAAIQLYPRFTGVVTMVLGVLLFPGIGLLADLRKQKERNMK